MRLLKQSTAYNLMVFMTDSSDHITGKASLTLTITASKNGAAFGSISPTVTDLGSGWYNLALTTSHTDTIGDLALHITSTGADASDLVIQVRAAVTDDIYSRLGAPAGASVSADIATVATYVDTEVAAILAAVDTEVAAIKAKTDNLPAAPAAVGDIPTANANADALLDRSAGVETGWTLRQAMRIILAVLAGKLSGAATTTIAIRDMADSKDRISATVDSSGNRTAVTRDAT